MKVILISSVSGLGNVGDVVEVKSGYGRNFLIPSKKAIHFSEINNKLFEEKRKHFEEENKKNIEISNEIKRALIGKNIVIIENSSDDGRLYGSVTAATIATKINAIAKQELIERSHIFLENQIKVIGVSKAKVSLHPDAEFDVQIVVCRNESEVDDILNAQKEAKKAEQARVQEEEDLLKSVARSESAAKEAESANEEAAPQQDSNQSK